MTENVPPADSASAAQTKDASPAAVSATSNITANLRADYEALQNDLEQAQELASDFQQQLAGKSNEVAHFKALLEKTQLDLVRMDGHVVELRRERHRLANEAMEVVGLQAQLEQMTRERDHYLRESHALRSALTSSDGEMQNRLKQQEAELTRLRAALEVLRSRQINAIRPAGEKGGPVPPAPASRDDDASMDVSFGT
jgi:phage-related tail protein